MKYEEYMEKHGIGFAHDAYEGGETSFETLGELLLTLQENGIECPKKVLGLIPVNIVIDVEYQIDKIEETLCEYEFAGEDYEMPESGKKFLEKCFEEYNEKYANHGNYFDGVSVEVPERLAYEIEVQDE